jgi:toxin ParE1/3/4
MAKAKIFISPLARIDLEEIWLYTFHQWSSNQANKYQDELFDAFELIVNDVAIGKKMDQIKSGYRYLRVNHHYIFYTCSEDLVTIIRVLHEKMDLPRHL